jgi:hypothetical protein
MPVAVSLGAGLRRRKSAVKRHTTVRCARGSIPSHVYVTGARPHSGRTASRSRSVLLDRLRGLRLPVRLHPSLRFLHFSFQKEYAVRGRASRPVERSAGVRSRLDHSADRNPHRTTLPRSVTAYRLHRCRDGRTTEVPDPQLPASPSGHRARWQVKLFFRWIKQHLRIKAFYGTSEKRGQAAGPVRPAYDLGKDLSSNTKSSEFSSKVPGRALSVDAQ